MLRPEISYLDLESAEGLSPGETLFVLRLQPNDPDMYRRLRALLYYAGFTPADIFGRPINSRIIVSFIGVTS
jgi:hypothetical protein